MASRFLLPPLSPAKDPSDYPYFKGSISRWAWRVWIQPLTPAGRWFLLASAIFTTYGGASLQLQGFVIAAYAQAVWLIAIIAMLLYRPKVKLVAHLSARVCAGQT